MDYSFICCNCMAITVCKSYNKPYDHPFIGCLFVNDEQYVKFCKNFGYYLSLEPTFGPPKEDSLWAKQNGSVWVYHKTLIPPYPVMHLEGIEIHWIHEESPEKLMVKYRKRRERFRENKRTPVFLFSSWEMMNDRSIEEYRKLVKEFISIPTSFFLTRYREDVNFNPKRIFLNKDWIGTGNDRDRSHLYTWSTLTKVEEHFIHIIHKTGLISEGLGARSATSERNSSGEKVGVYIFGDANLWKYTEGAIRRTLLSFSNTDIFICTIGHKIAFEACSNETITQPLPIKVMAKKADIISNYNMDLCISKCESARQRLNKEYSKLIYVPIGSVSNYSVPKLCQWFMIQDSLSIISSTHTNLGPIKDLNEPVRKKLFDYLYDGRVCDISSLDMGRIQTNDQSLIFFIPSVIHMNPNHHKSLFNASERLKQTVKQVKSIREKVENAVIILLEMSELDLDELNRLVECVDRICLFTKDEKGQFFAHKDPNKNKAEVYVIRKVLSQIENIPYSHFFKFGGRYWLSDEFKVENVVSSTPSFRIIPGEYNHSKDTLVESVIYSIPKLYYRVYCSCLEEIHNVLSKQFLDVERLLYKTLMKRNVHIHNFEYAYVFGYAATSGIFRYI